MAEKRKRGQNFTNDDKDKLIKLLSNYKDTILNKKTDGTTNQAKNDAWVSLTTRYNSTGSGSYRSKDSLIKLWEKLKSEAKIYGSSMRRSMTGTGGGPSTVRTDPILAQVCDILGRGCTGIENVNDSDMDMVHSNALPEVGEEIILVEVKDIVEQQVHDEDPVPVVVNESVTTSTPSVNMFATPSCPWKRRRPVPETIKNERSEAVALLCAEYTNINSKKKDIEELKKTLLGEEIEFKRRLYELQLQAATKDLEIKSAILAQIKGGSQQPSSKTNDDLNPMPDKQ